MVARKILALSLSVTVFTSMAHADDASLESFLERFHSDPARVMNEPIQKFDANGNPVSTPESVFSADQIQNRDFVTAKDNLRSRFCKMTSEGEVCVRDMLPGRAPITADDEVQMLVDNADDVIRTLAEMDRKRLTSARLPEDPWSDDYWAIYKGILGARYADPTWPADEDWKKNNDYASKGDRSFVGLFNNLVNFSSIDTLSPSEKYDLLVGDANTTLTKKMWAEGESYFRETGKVETWMGICHGWAVVSYMLPRPTSVVTMTAADGKTKINFYPSDIKALASLLWANAQPMTVNIGGRCNAKEPKMDKNGRVLSEACFDNNPGAWHMAVVNQIGVSKRSLVIDATYDYEVWNQPVLSYSYTYFNPQTGKAAKTAATAKVATEDFTNDKFPKYRSKDANSIVGVKMDVTYTVETQPEQRKTDSPEYDMTRTASYVYDLELDKNGEIIGGEWYQNLHPDFVWTAPKGERAVSVAERALVGKWDGMTAFPKKWTRAAARASQEGQPLTAVVETLIAISRAQR